MEVPEKSLDDRLERIECQLAQLIQAIGQRPASRTILPLADAAIALGYGNPENPRSAYEAAYRRINTGHYRVGIEAIDRRMPGSTQACWYLDIEKCRDRDRTMAAKRK